MNSERHTNGPSASGDRSPHSVPAPLALDQVVDDLEPISQCRQWAGAQLLAGRTPEELVEELIAGGWDADAAAEHVEYARRETRRERGIVTREDVAMEAAISYRRTMRVSWLIGFPLWASIRRVVFSAGYLLSSLRRPRK